ncbi:hypothetical protein PIB30_049145 [Stylosanthes scabra]|uniref:Uncharacterized protein n=1 Tax=Stylosanthes scabra TaxID=79078 RepID=A0ABU6YG25_9FABA|nr:hypothetical protein [Stylosanthes scabra]
MYTASSSRQYLTSSFDLNGTEQLFGLIRRCDDRNVVDRCQRESAMAWILSSLLNLRGVVYAGRKLTDAVNHLTCYGSQGTPTKVAFPTDGMLERC